MNWSLMKGGTGREYRNTFYIRANPIRVLKDEYCSSSAEEKEDFPGRRITLSKGQKEQWDWTKLRG